MKGSFLESKEQHLQRGYAFFIRPVKETQAYYKKTSGERYLFTSAPAPISSRATFSCPALTGMWHMQIRGCTRW